MTPDCELLATFARTNSEDAFAEVVKRHVSLVYSAALRQVGGDGHLAQDVAQAVFSDLARKAAALSRHQNLSGWLYTSAHFAAAKIIRTETRRRDREEKFMREPTNDSGTGVSPVQSANEIEWENLRPVLDAAMHELKDADREAILLRYFENRPFAEVGAKIGLNENAARMRVDRAVEKLRAILAQRGLTAGATLASVISANAVQAAPAGIAATISAAAALAGTAVHTTTLIAATKTIVMTTLQKTLITATVAILAGAGIYEAHQAMQLREQNQTLQQQQAPLAEQLTKLQTENERLSNQVAQAKDSQALSKAQFSELLKLRGKAGVAQADSHELAKLKSTLAQQAGQMPDYMTNAIATGLGTAEKFKMKDAQAKLARMKKTLGLTDEQTQAISDVMQRHIKKQTELTMQSITGKMTPGQQQALIAEGGNQDDEIKALFTVEQLAAYSEYQQAEKTFAADQSASGDASRLADDFNLSKEQQEQIRAAFYEMNLNQQASVNTKAIAAAKKGGNLTDYIGMSIELSKSQLEEKLKILGTVLTAEQINTYREEQLNRIKTMEAGMSMLVPQKPAGTKN